MGLDPCRNHSFIPPAGRCLTAADPFCSFIKTKGPVAFPASAAPSKERIYYVRRKEVIKEINYSRSYYDSFFAGEFGEILGVHRFDTTMFAYRVGNLLCRYKAAFDVVDSPRFHMCRPAQQVIKLA